MRFTIGLVALLLTISSAYSQDLRMANGVIVKGTVAKATESGLDVQTATGVRNLTWETLAPSTRYQYEPLFRANYDAVLAGLPASARTNAPPAAAEEAEEEDEDEEADEQKAAPAASESKSLSLFDQLSYQPLNPFFASSFPASEISSPAMARIAGIQFGPSQSDVIYLAFDARGSKDILDTMVLYTPSNPAYSTPVRITGFKKTSADTKVVSFKKFSLSTQVGNLAITYEIECASRMYEPRVDLAISVQLAAGDTKSRFGLNGALMDFAQDKELVKVIGLLDQPMISIEVSPDPSNPTLNGSLTMSGMRLIPRDGMNPRMTVEVLTEQDDPLQKEIVRMDDSAITEIPALLCALKKVQPTQTYNVSASIDLGPMLGPVSYEDTITIPKLGK